MCFVIVEIKGVRMIKINYDKLWKKLESRNMLKTELIKETGISTNAMAKLGKNEDVRLNILAKICKFFDCKLDDIVEINYDD